MASVVSVKLVLRAKLASQQVSLHAKAVRVAKCRNLGPASVIVVISASIRSLQMSWQMRVAVRFVLRASSKRQAQREYLAILVRLGNTSHMKDAKIASCALLVNTTLQLNKLDAWTVPTTSILLKVLLRVRNVPLVATPKSVRARLATLVNFKVASASHHVSHAILVCMSLRRDRTLALIVRSAISLQTVEWFHVLSAPPENLPEQRANEPVVHARQESISRQPVKQNASNAMKGATNPKKAEQYACNARQVQCRLQTVSSARNVRSVGLSTHPHK